jgi:polyphosphate kinase
VKKFTNKEISWLSFNDRVLQEAANPEVPLLERIKFLGIFSSNLDEFFRVRVATLNRLAKLGKPAKKLIGHDPKSVLKRIQKIEVMRHETFNSVYHQILEDLAKENIHIVDETGLSRAQNEFVKSYFAEKVRPQLMPVMIDQAGKFPELQDRSIYLAVHLSAKGRPDDKKYALIEIPTDVLPRFVILPPFRNRKCIILLDDIIRFGLDEIFSIFPFDHTAAYTIKLTRDAELDIEDDLSESYIKKISSSLKKREGGVPVRFIYDAKIPEDLLGFIKEKLHLGPDDTLVPAGKYHNSKDFMEFPDMGLEHLKYTPIAFLPHRDIDPEHGIFWSMRKRDILLHYPYQTFQYVLDLLRDASIDPKVRSIKITLYRVAKNSSVVSALINAVRNGKKVIVNMELQARFDEEANIYWANKLQEEGARVSFGVPGLKVHCKLCLITRDEKNGPMRYGIIGTGNFNEDTARIYSDHHLFTTDKRLTREIDKVFDFFANNYNVPKFKHFAVSPFDTRKVLMKHIRREIKNKQEGNEAYIILKLNNLADAAIIRKLYEASEAGVPILLFIRSMFSLIPGIEGLSSNIRAFSIVDKFLEHSRIFLFCNGGEERIYITSADLMPRNLDRRVEVTCPIYDPELQQELRTFLRLQLEDNTRARILDKDLANTPVPADTEKGSRAQWSTYAYLKKLAATPRPKDGGTSPDAAKPAKGSEPQGKEDGQKQEQKPVQTG